MIRLTQVKLPVTHSPSDLRVAIARKLKIDSAKIKKFTIARRSTDARKKHSILFIYTIDVLIADEKSILNRFKKEREITLAPDLNYHFAMDCKKSPAERPVVIGSGPAGFMAGLLLAQMGLRPIILERGKNVRDRSRDTFKFWSGGTFNPESNVQFGEGGAGTFSDGKLNSQIKDPRHLGHKVLTELVEAGAPPEILYLNKPHVGSYRLVGVLKNIRKTIESLGGEYRFQSRVDNLEIVDGQLKAVILQSGERILSSHAVLAIGHSARDTFQMLYKNGVHIDPKPFSIGFRIEHPQSYIDRCRYGNMAGSPLLGAADYKLVHHCANGRTVYSFCMCPGGSVVAATSEEGHVVTNGMSQYSRNEKNANSGIVVGIDPSDFPEGPLGGVELQDRLEKNAFILGESNYSAPAQRVKDFLQGIPSIGPGSVTPSYKPGVHFCDLSSALPDYAIEAIREAIPAFDKQIPGFSMDDALLTAVETRTSSPIRITREKDSLQSLSVKGLYPAGEGAGYAGGIFSAAIDGIKVAEAIALSMCHTEIKS